MTDLTASQVHDVLWAYLRNPRVPVLAAAARTREWHLGHIHTAKKRERLGRGPQAPADLGSFPVVYHRGVTMQWIRALSATSAWAYREGYLGDDRGAEVYFYHRDHGYCGHNVARVRIEV